MATPVGKRKLPLMAPTTFAGVMTLLYPRLRWLVTDSLVNEILVIDTANGNVASTISSSVFSNLNGIAISPDGKYLYVANSGTNQVLIISVATGRIVSTINKGFSNPMGIAFAPNGAYLYVVNFWPSNVVIVNPGSYN